MATRATCCHAVHRILQHLLLIEDDNDIARILQADLQDAGYLVSHATSVITGLTSARERRPNLMVLDLGLTDGDSRDVLKRVCKGSKIPIIGCILVVR
ncbi:response regulator [Deinococcus ruber]|uniref:response regulator n=1 Tax=Deinococcus ruber TaxID=1848197 RepID=UPI003570F12B